MAANKKNPTSFSTVIQPHNRGAVGSGRIKGSKNKKTIALKAFEDLGYDPIKCQVALALQYQLLIQKGRNFSTEDENGNTVLGDPLTVIQMASMMDKFGKVNSELMQYQSPKASNEPEFIESEESDEPVQANGPLTNRDLNRITSDMVKAKSDCNKRF
jgi:hypothetical protein